VSLGYGPSRKHGHTPGGYNVTSDKWSSRQRCVCSGYQSQIASCAWSLSCNSTFRRELITSQTIQNNQIRRSPFWQVRLGIHQNTLFRRCSPMTRQVSYHSIVLAVKRKELVLREKGLVCLGLCCLIAQRMALNLF
jgi:hypothetical protein